MMRLICRCKPPRSSRLGAFGLILLSIAGCTSGHPPFSLPPVAIQESDILVDQRHLAGETVEGVCSAAAHTLRGLAFTLENEVHFRRDGLDFVEIRALRRGFQRVRVVLEGLGADDTLVFVQVAPPDALLAIEIQEELKGHLQERRATIGATDDP